MSQSSRAVRLLLIFSLLIPLVACNAYAYNDDGTLRPTSTSRWDPTSTKTSTPTNTLRPVAMPTIPLTRPPTNTPAPRGVYVLPDGTVGELAEVSGVPSAVSIYVTFVASGEEALVRYIGLAELPEDHQWTRRAVLANASFVNDKTVVLVRDFVNADEKGNLWRYVFLQDGTFVNLELVKQGLVLLQETPLNTDYTTLLLKAYPTSAPVVTARPAASTFTPRPANTPRPVNTPTIRPTFVPSLTPSGSGGGGGACSCSGNTLNCSDFSSTSSAQRCFDYCRGLGRGDIHDLDRDGDGRACE